ncbi:3-deoxy-D-manno-octulosonic acid transferase [Acidimangrovimonas pyrenivorans]|uniref:3-deoxy-D-manno-octulosonic acid transferase n=1 Tax=Acidimangrovimonas pyrenivorans TaxID=2030798 RepID=A0ABV7ADB4_9RHOB
MAFPLGLGLYLLFTARRAHSAPGEEPPRPERPPGPLIWLHAAPEQPGGHGALAELVRRLRALRPGLTVLISAKGDSHWPEGSRVVPPPPETLPDIHAFVSHWRPDLAVLSGASLPPALIHETDRCGVPIYLVDAVPPPPGRRPRFPGVVRALLSRLAAILARDAEAGRGLRRLGAAPARLDIAGKMQEEPAVLPYVEAEREALAGLARSRPVWLAAGLPEVEEAAVIAAHHAALRLAHRLLLIVVPEDPERGPALAARVEAEQGWTVALRSADEEPGEECQAYVADTEGELGLWYRLASISYMGGSLQGAGSTRSPYEPAALGSAIIHGPRPGDHAGAYERLVEARATRELRVPGDLGEALSDLIAPDRAALIAHNAWEASTAGAEVTERVAALLLAALDERAPAEEES